MNDTAAATVPESESVTPVPASALATAPESPAAAPPPTNIIKLRAEEAVTMLMEYAMALPASDLFIVAGEKEHQVLVRSLGLLRSVISIPSEVARKWVAYLKVAAQMDINERRRPTDGRWVYRPLGSRQSVDVRMSTIPTLYGEDLAMRILDLGTAQFELGNMGMTRDQCDELVTAASNPGGLILVTGPSGAGKTATLYALLRYLNDGRKKINTIEDPVEYAVPGVRQSQVNSALKLTFPTLLRAVLRQVPDIIMVGEIRDEETAATAVAAANTGHLVLATVHAGAAALAPQAMLGLGVSAQALSFSLRCVVSQRLARTLCTQCRRAFPVDDLPHLFNDVAQLLASDQGKALYAPSGCETCHQTGYTGRSGIFEIMPVTGAVRAAIAQGSSATKIQKAAVDAGMLTFRQAALLKVATGATSTEELFRVLPAENLSRDLIATWD